MPQSRRNSGHSPPRRSVDEILTVAVKHHKSGNLSEAEAHYRQVLQQAPTNASALHYLGLIARQVGKLEYAIEFFEQALQSAPNDAALRYNFGLTLQQLGRRNEALIQYQKAIELQPGFAQAHNNLGVVLQDLGRNGEANRSFVEAMGHNPRLAEAYYNLAQSKKYTTESVEVGKVRDLLSATDISNDDKIRLHFTLGKIYDDIGKYTEAFEQFQIANKSKSSVFDADAYGLLIEQTIQTFDRKFFQQRQGLGDPDTRPIFIVGLPRSGTTLLEQIISSHADVYGAGELDYIEKMASSLQTLTESNDAYPLCAKDLDRDATRFLARDYASRVQANAAGETRITDKTPLNFIYLGLIALMFPRAYIIHCRRHPLDVCLSCYFQNFSHEQSFAYDLEHLGIFYRHYERLMKHWRENLGIDIFEVRYETLIENQETVTRDMLSFCDLSWDSRCLSFHENNRIVNTASKWQVRQPLYRDAIGRWKHYEEFLGPLNAALNGQERGDDV